MHEELVPGQNIVLLAFYSALLHYSRLMKHDPNLPPEGCAVPPINPGIGDRARAQ